ncbi:Transcriptional regulatory protein DegU [Phycisphaerales bacterium]|nr:Transcriptional regulatory protein DegU [Phycisphaerales bacterium]
MSTARGRFRVLCVDDNQLLTESLRRRISGDPDLEWVGVIHGGAGIHAAVIETRPDIVLMDIDMPLVDTFAIVERLAAEAPGIRVVMFSGHVSPDYIARALDCGAWGYLSKNDDVAALIDGIKQVGGGEIILSKEAQAVHSRRPM